MKRTQLTLAAVLLAALAQTSTADDKQGDGQDADRLNALERKFQETMNGVKLVGSYTVERDGKTTEPREEEYTILEVQKLEGDLWQITSRIKFGKFDVKLPLPIPVKFAGGTPVLTVDNLKVPGIGTYNARVVINNGRYAGTWSAPDHGGHLWGKLVPLEDAEAPQKKPKQANKGDK